MCSKNDNDPSADPGPEALIEDICAQLRQALRHSDDSPIESLLQDTPETLRDRVLEELVADK